MGVKYSFIAIKMRGSITRVILSSHFLAVNKTHFASERSERGQSGRILRYNRASARAQDASCKLPLRPDIRIGR